MATISSKKAMSNFYGVLMEINFHKSDEEFLAEIQEKPDPKIDEHLLKIKQLSARLKAEATKARFKKAIEQIRVLKQKSMGELKRLIQPEEQAQLMPLFRKFEELSKEDETEICQDQELLLFIETLKDKLDDNSSD